MTRYICRNSNDQMDTLMQQQGMIWWCSDLSGYMNQSATSKADCYTGMAVSEETPLYRNDIDQSHMTKY